MNILKMNTDSCLDPYIDFNGCEKMWKDINERTQLMRIRNQRRKSSFLQWAMESMLHYSTCQYSEMKFKEGIKMLGKPHI